MMLTAERSDFVHDLTEQGTIESGNNVEVRCEVKSVGYLGTTILEIVPEGKMVEQGEILAKLDSSSLDSDCTKQQISVCMSEADLIKAKTTLDTALLTSKEFLEGTFKQQREVVESEVFVAEENLRRAQEYAQFSERLARKGYVTILQLEADRFAVEKSRKDLDSAKTKFKVLSGFTKEKTVTQLDADIKSAEAKLKAQQSSHKLESEKLALIEDQIQKCVIKAPCAGQVVYANVINAWGDKPVVIEAGATVRERQVLIHLPDRDQMQVKTRINESKIALVSHGLEVTMHLDALPEVELYGTVEKVEEYPAPTNRFTSSVKEYETTIRIHHSPPNLRPGLTAEAKIHVERFPGVINVPVQAILEHGDKHYCILRNDDAFQLREVKIGSTNDKCVVIRAGLAEGEQVVRNPSAYREKVELPELPRDEGPAMLAKASRAAKAKKAVADAGRGKSEGFKKAEAAPPVANPAATVERLFAQYDKGHSGRLRVTDLPTDIRVWVASADTNGDGLVDRSELASAMARPVRAPARDGKRVAGTQP